ncbi:hypothetical protein ACIO8F_34600 [Streptomyces sp. NPDC087228]|uniref:hypothetical protein n=1 Tax=unclassified Streptomyces TaxID=2593676 RepID=UPI003405DB70
MKARFDAPRRRGAAAANDLLRAEAIGRLFTSRGSDLPQVRHVPHLTARSRPCVDAVAAHVAERGLAALVGGPGTYR